jgi:nucleoid-associated protein YgaU
MSGSKYMAPLRTTRLTISARLRLGLMVVLLPLHFAAPASAQSLGDLARQERERKGDQPHRTVHVYINEDLARPQILVPEDQKRIQVKKGVPQIGEPSPKVVSPAGEQAQFTILPFTRVAGRHLLTQMQRPREVSATVAPSTSAARLAAPSLAPAPLNNVTHAAPVQVASTQAHDRPTANDSTDAVKRPTASVAVLAAPSLAPAPLNNVSHAAPVQVASTQAPHDRPTAIDSADAVKRPSTSAARSAAPSLAPAPLNVVSHSAPVQVASTQTQHDKATVTATTDAVKRPSTSAAGLAAPSLAPAPLNVVSHSAPVQVASTQAPHERPTATDSTDAVKRVRVERGDTLYGIAKVHLGRGEDWPRLAASNPKVTDPTHLPVGTWLRLPNEEPVLQVSRRIRVESGDSLSKLARAHLGDGQAWTCIAQMNPQLHDANLILPGQMLTVPESCTTASTQSSHAAVPERPVQASIISSH